MKKEDTRLSLILWLFKRVLITMVRLSLLTLVIYWLLVLFFLPFQAYYVNGNSYFLLIYIVYVAVFCVIIELMQQK